MTKLVIDFQEGFAEDTIVVLIDDREVFRKQAVTTNFLLGHADSFETEVSEPPFEVEVSVTSRGLSGGIRLDPVGAVYLGVSVGDREITFVVSDQPFGYA